MYLERLASAMQKRWPKAAEMLLDAREDILVYKTFPEEHLPDLSIQSTHLSD
jgi:hypothetical protein